MRALQGMDLVPFIDSIFLPEKLMRICTAPSILLPCFVIW